ncbi:MAG: ATP-dependent Clp protease ATP-binding subunit [Patescibacteria group bacterium]|nr:ATP-dependent Clp protease ATP-binding subunit [Patescibacteria group bacterium]
MNNFFPQKIQNKFTSHLKDVIKTAEDVSREFKHQSIRTEHIIFGILSQGGSIGSNVLGGEKINLKTFRQIIDELPKTKTWKPKLSDELKNIFKKSVLVASKYKHTYIGTEHLLYAILDDDNEKVTGIFSSIGFKPDKLKEQLKRIMEGSSRFFDVVDLFSSSLNVQKVGAINPNKVGKSLNSGMISEMSMGASPAGIKQSALDYFCVDLVKEFEEGIVDPIIGRDEEIKRLINVLNRKTKNNPILIGEPGIGKTAIVQGLAQKIFEGNIPASLFNKKIYSLDLGLLVAGAVFRGEFEARLKDVIGEAQSNPDVILFIDEIHTIVGAGSAGGSGSLDAANILKAPLAQGELSCIGATTLDEYRKHFKKDAALERRFQMIVVDEPSVEDTKKILQGLKPIYEKHHNLEISAEAIEAAVDLSERFINDRFLPDKAFDILDEAASLVRSRQSGKNYFGKIKELEKRKKILQAEKEKAVEEEKYDKALLLKEEETALRKAVAKLFEIQKKESKVRIKTPLSVDDLAEVITQMTGVPVKKLISSERKKLKNIERNLKKEIIGQDEAIEVISKSIRRSRLGIANANRPNGVFMFLGPTGVGKTELTKVLAKTVYEKKEALIKVDMSEFMERHNVSRLVGAPAGYVGYEEGGKLTEQVRLNPYSVILFDEIEKAHPDVFNLLLQIFEDGEITDAAGKKIDFKNTIIIMTSNIGTEELTYEARWGFSENENIGEDEKKNRARKKYLETKSNVLKELKDEFSPEFINRIDKIIVFNPLSMKDIKTIVKNQFGDLQERILESNKIKISADKKALAYISKKSFNPNEGARLVRRNLQEMVEDLISEEIVEENIKEGDKIKLSVGKAGLSVCK